MDSPRTTDEVKPLDAGWVAEEAARAAEVISRYLRPTPCRLTEHFSEQLGLEVYLKPENFQRTGSFKVRGAFYAASRLTPSQRQWGVVTASAGNHAQGVAFAAKQMRVRALVVMPEYTPNTKLDAVRALGAEVELFGPTFDDAYARAREHESARGLAMIPPFDHPDVIAATKRADRRVVKLANLIRRDSVPAVAAHQVLDAQNLRGATPHQLGAFAQEVAHGALLSRVDVARW